MHLVLRFLVVSVGSAVSACWLRFLQKHSKPGLLRMLSCLPSLLFSIVAQSCFHHEREFLTKSNIMVIFTWAATFKALAFCLGRGPLSQPLSLLHFILTYSLPIIPVQTGNGKLYKGKPDKGLEHAKYFSSLTRHCIGKVVLMIALVLLLSQYNDTLPLMLREISHVFLFYAFLGSVTDVNAMLLIKLAGLAIIPYFDSPFLSTSVGEFWSKRWNLTTSNTLRTLVYDPIHEGRLIASKHPSKVSHTRSRTAICATFVVSGLMHFLYLRLWNSEVTAFPWFLFFASQGPLIILENSILQSAKRHGLLPPKWVRIPFTILLIWSTANKLLFPPAYQARLAEISLQCFMESCRSIYDASTWLGLK